MLVGHPHEEAVCSFCDTAVEVQILAKYFKVRNEVEEVLAKKEMTDEALTKCMNLITGLLHPYDLAFISVCQVALTDCIVQNKLKEGLEFGNLLLEVSRRLAKGSPSHIELVLRLMRLQAELGLKKDLEKLAKDGLSDAYGDIKLRSQILLYKQIIMDKMICEK